MAVLASTAAWLPARGQDLPPRLEEWRREIEADGRVRLLVGRVNWDREANTLSLAPQTPEPELFARHLRSAEFAAQFRRVHAVTASERNGDRFLFLVFLNRGYLSQWGAYEEALLAHELFHAWFIAQRYPVPVAQPGKAGCLSVATLDLVQHVVMRDELKRRAIDHAKYQRRKREIAVEEEMAKPGGANGDACARVSAVSEWVDMRLELGVDGEYEAMMRRRFPGVAEVGGEVAAYLSGRNLRDRAAHREALSFVFYRLRQFWDTGK
jgi:hypothetical protein